MDYSGRPKSSPQGTLQKLKNWLCNAGNSVENQAGKLAVAGAVIEVGGAAVTVAGLIGQPEINPVATTVTGVGLAAMATGAAAGTLATVMQVGGGIAQMIGSNDSSVGANNAWAGSAALLAGAGTGWVTGGSSPTASGLIGVASDSAVGAFPGMTPGQAQCGANP
jgi:hypothetical protein